MSEYKKLGKNIFLITIGNFSSKMLSFFLIPLYTAVLSTEEYGVSDLITTTVNLLLPFFTLLISEAVTRFTLDKTSDKNQIFSIGFWINFTGFILMCLLSPMIAMNKALSDFYGIFIIFYGITALHTFVGHFVKGIEEIAVYTVSGVLSTIINISFNILFLVFLKLGLYGYLWAHICANIASTLYMIIKCDLKKYFISIKKLDIKYIKGMIAYAIPLIPNSMSWWLSNSAGKYIVTAVCGVAMNGIYSVAYRIPSLFSVFSTIFMSAWQISAVNTFDSENAASFYTKVYKIYMVFNLLLVSALICGTKILAQFLFLNDFYVAWKYVPVLLIGYLFNAASTYLGTIYTSAKKTNIIFFTTGMGAIVNIVMNAVLVPRIGIYGAAISTFLCYFVIWLVRVIDSRKIMKLDINHFKDAICFIIIIIQCIIRCADIPYNFYLSIVLFGVIAIVNFSVLKDILETFINKVLRRR